jgi:hypothetical protein
MAGGGRAGCKRPLSRVMGRASAAERTGGTQGGCTLPRRRRRLPDDALIVLEVGLGLAEEVPVGHRPEIIVPTRWERCEGTANSRAREGSGWSSSGAGLRRAGPPGVGPISGRAGIARDAQADSGADAGFWAGAAVGSTTQDMPLPSQTPMSLSRSSRQGVETAQVFWSGG